ncbi:MAG: tetratricopeptide repeat protein [Bacteroidetes bacterium]|nr:tetratricopeptide repeat protein [Bacteroidota bacterium]
MKSLLLVVFFTCQLCSNISAQDIDSLKLQLTHEKNDTTRCRILNEIATYAYYNYGFDSCKKYSAMALELADQLLRYNEPVNNPAYFLQCKKLKAKALENWGGAIAYLDATAAKDSLLVAASLWNETKDVSGRASVYMRLGEFFMNQNDFENSVKYFDSSLVFYKSLNDSANIGNVYFESSLTLRAMGKYGDAMENNIDALYIFRKLKDTLSEMQCQFANGFIFMLVKDYDEALKVQLSVLKTAIKLNKPDLIAQAYNDLGVTNMRKGNLAEALKYHTKALEIRKQANLVSIISNSYNYIGTILEDQEKYKEAIASNLEGLSYAKKQGDGRYILDLYYNIAVEYFKLKEYKNALNYYDTVLQVSNRGNDVFMRASSMQGFAKIYMAMNKPAEAMSWLHKALAITIATDFMNQRDIYQSLSEVYAKTGDYKNAYQYSLKYKQYADSLANQEKAAKLTSLANQLDFENKRALMKASQDKQLAIQQSQIDKQKLIRNIFIAGLIIFIGLAVLFFIRFTEKKRLNLTLEQTLNNLKSTQAQLIQSEKMAGLGELTAGIAHEIQNPLNFVNNFSEVSNELVEELRIKNYELKVEDPEVKSLLNDIAQNLEKINHHGKRADSIVKNMLQHSRKSSGQKEPTDINALCDEYLRLSYHGLRAKDKAFNAKFETDFDGSIGKIHVVQQDLGRVILNLVNNAFYAVNEKKKQNPAGSTEQPYEPTVTVTTKKEAGKVIISVKDNGTGIPATIKNKIFQPFYTTKPSGSGTGLGLSLSYDIVKAHGGELKVESPPPGDAGKDGVGTEFIVKIPV